MRRVFAFALLASVAMISFSASYAADKPAEKSKTDVAFCPVAGIGKDINKDNAVEFEGGQVYFCCQNCPKKFAKDSSKFETKARHQLVATGQLVQKGCPFSGGPVKADFKTDVAGVEVGFCCAGCQSKVAKLEKPEEKIDAVFKSTEKGFKLAKATTK